VKWHHSPVHKLGAAGAYMVTCGTLGKEHFFRGPERLDRLQELFFELAAQYSWELQAWSLLSNHYHFVSLAPPDATSLRRFIQHFHSVSAREVNRLDGTRGRKVWFEYWDSHITFEKSYYARLAYVHKNAVHHGLVAEARAYPWCSAAWFERSDEPAFYKQIMKYGTEKLNIPNDY
jgi:REP-associated tyrosine transposase